MAQYKHLPIYKATYNLLEAITRVTRHYPKEYKFSLGQKLRAERGRVGDLLFDFHGCRMDPDRTKMII